MVNPIQAECLQAMDGISHAFFTREGGVSAGIYDSLNVGLGSDDARDQVLENRARVARALGHPGTPLNTLHQVHSADAIVIDGPMTDQPPRADGIVTTTPGVIIGALAADCTPVLFADPQARVIAAAHAGWRGAAAGILEETVATMLKSGADVSRIAAAIGPTINQASYEVGPEFETQFLESDPQNQRFFKRYQHDGRPHFDLPGYVAHRLNTLGIRSVERQSLCTYENESRLFSYRRATHRSEPDYGRQISAIVLN